MNLNCSTKIIEANFFCYTVESYFSCIGKVAFKHYSSEYFYSKESYVSSGSIEYVKKVVSTRRYTDFELRRATLI